MIDRRPRRISVVNVTIAGTDNFVCPPDMLAPYALAACSCSDAFQPSHKLLRFFGGPRIPTIASVASHVGSCQSVGEIAIADTPSRSAVTISPKFSKASWCVMWRTDGSELENDACLHV